MIQALQSITKNPLDQCEMHFDGERFVGMVPLVTEEFGGIGVPSEEIDPAAIDPRSITPLEVTDFQKVVRDEEESGDTGTTTTTTQKPEEPIVRPEATVNNEEEQAFEDNTIAAILDTANTKPVSAITEGPVNNFTMPEEATVSAYIAGPIQNGATFTNRSGKYIVVENTSDTPVDIIIDTEGSTASSPIYIRGKFNNIYLDGKTIPVSSSKYPDVYGTISIEDNGETYTGVNITVNFVGDECGIKYLGTAPITISDGDTTEMGSPVIYAPHATVTMGGQYTNVEATVSDETLILKSGFHALSLKVKKGNIKIYGLDINDFADSVEAAGTIEPMSWNIPDDGTLSKMTSNPGVYNITSDVVTSSTIGFGAFASGKYRYNNNGHRVATSNKNYLMFLRNKVEVSIYGTGKWENITETGDGYLIWLSGPDTKMDIYGGEFEGKVHTLYAEKGTINVYGGTYKLKDAATADRDINGNLKFLLNCLDASYQAGTAKINVYGGRFYEFNPAVSYSEPEGPVSFVAPGYHVVEGEDEGVRYYDVVAD